MGKKIYDIPLPRDTTLPICSHVDNMCSVSASPPLKPDSGLGEKKPSKWSAWLHHPHSTCQRTYGQSGRCVHFSICCVDNVRTQLVRLTLLKDSASKSHDNTRWDPAPLYSLRPACSLLLRVGRRAPLKSWCKCSRHMLGITPLPPAPPSTADMLQCDRNPILALASSDTFLTLNCETLRT